MGKLTSPRQCLDFPSNDTALELIAHNIMISRLDRLSSSRIVTLILPTDVILIQLPTMPTQQTQMFGESTVRSLSKEKQGMYIR